MNEQLPYDYWREFPDRDPQAMVWYPLSFGPVEPNEIWPARKQALRAETSLYVHVPFCAVICPFCPFNKYPSVEDQMQAFVQAVKREISMLGERAQWQEMTMRAAFFGGGTPTALSADQLVEIITHARRILPWKPGAEITVEGSPETLTIDKLAALRDAGVNRISFGVQSFDDQYLRMIGRGHNSDMAKRAVDMVLNAGFDNLAIDMMYRLPGQTMEEWERELSVALSTGVPHISAYSLFVEPGSALAKVRRRGKMIEQASVETDLDMWRLCIDTLESRGYTLYTLYDFALAGRASDHHLINWRAPQAEYVGIGPGAFSYVQSPNGEFVYGNINPIDQYCEMLAADRLPIDFGIRLSEEESMARYMVLGTNALRIPKQPFADRYGTTIDQQFGDTVDRLVELGLVENTAASINLTLQGKLYLANVGKSFASEMSRMKPHPAGVDLQRGEGLSLSGIVST
jgi:oxygen-independent coproporphyrinogen III oxidase